MNLIDKSDSSNFTELCNFMLFSDNHTALKYCDEIGDYLLKWTMAETEDESINTINPSKMPSELLELIDKNLSLEKSCKKLEIDHWQFLDIGGFTLLHIAAATGRVDCIKALVEAGAEVNAVNDWGVPPLFYAAIWKYTQAAKLLVSYGANPFERYIIEPVSVVTMIPDIFDGLVSFQ